MPAFHSVFTGTNILLAFLLSLAAVGFFGVRAFAKGGKRIAAHH